MRAPCTYEKTVSPSIGIAIVNNIMPPTMLFQKCLAQENPASTVNHIGFMNKLLTTFSQRRIPSWGWVSGPSDHVYPIYVIITSLLPVWTTIIFLYLGLNLNVGKTNYCLGNLDPGWAIFSKWGQNVSRWGTKKLFVAVWNSLLVNVWTSLCWIPSWQKFWRQIEATKVTLLCKYAHFSQTLPWHYADNSGDTSFFLSNLVSNVSPLTWTCQFENSSA